MSVPEDRRVALPGGRMDRRRWLRAAGLLGMTALAGCVMPGTPSGPGPLFARGDKRLGVQLSMLAPDLEADFDGTLARLRGIGLGAVETAGFHNRSAAQLRASFDRTGLRCSSAHVPARAYHGSASLDGDLDVLARDMHVIGVTDVVMQAPLLPRPVGTVDEFRAATAALTVDDWRRTADFLDTVSRELHRRDLSTSYHNHNFEFVPHDGAIGMDLLLSETDPALVSFEMDAGWVAAAGLDPVALLRAHPGRFSQMHVKDLPTGSASPAMDWPAIFAAAEVAGVSRYYIEHEPPYAGFRMDVVARSAAYLLSLPA